MFYVLWYLHLLLYNILASVRQHRTILYPFEWQITIPFENNNDVIVDALKKIVSYTRRNQYLFVANCAWWIAGVIGLDKGLIIYIDNLESRRTITPIWAVSNTPRDIARGVSPQRQSSDYIPTQLGGTRKGRINPTPTSKKQLKKARRVKRLQEAEETKRGQRLEGMRARIIQNLSKE